MPFADRQRHDRAVYERGREVRRGTSAVAEVIYYDRMAK